MAAVDLYSSADRIKWAKQTTTQQIVSKKPEQWTCGQPTVSRCCTVGCGGEQCSVAYTHQTHLLMTTDLPNVGARLLSAGGARLGATISPSIMSQTSRVSPPVTSHQLRLQWTLDILHILCLNPSHSLYKLYANYLSNTYWLVSFLGIPEWFIIVMSRLTQPLMWLHICLFSFQQLVVELWRLQRKCYLGKYWKDCCWSD